MTPSLSTGTLTQPITEAGLLLYCTCDGDGMEGASHSTEDADDDEVIPDLDDFEGES